MKLKFSTAYVDDNLVSYATQTINRPSVSIGPVIGRIRNNLAPKSPQNISDLFKYASALECLRIGIDRAGVILDSGDIIVGLTKALNTWTFTDMTGWMTTNAVILGVACYWTWPAGKRLLAAVHKTLMSSYTPRKGV